MNGYSLINLPTPVNLTSAANKNYVDTQKQAANDYTDTKVTAINTKLTSAVDVWDIKISARDTNHNGWVKWTKGMQILKSAYPDFVNNIPPSLVTEGLVTNGLLYITLNDMAGRYLGVAGSGSGLTQRSVGEKIGAESITNVPLHDHIMDHTHMASSASDSHNHTMNHTHTINHDHSVFSSGTNTAPLLHTHSMFHDHPSVRTSQDTHIHRLKTSPNNAAIAGIIVGFPSTSSGGFADFNRSGGAGPNKINTSIAVSGYTTSDTHNHTVDIPAYTGNTAGTSVTMDHVHNIDVPRFSGTSGSASTSTTTSDTHNHKLIVDPYNAQTGKAGTSFVDVMNPGVFFNIFVYVGNSV
jgi:hypothetical protein